MRPVLLVANVGAPVRQVRNALRVKQKAPHPHPKIAICGTTVAAKWQQFVANLGARCAGDRGALRWGILSVIASRIAVLLVAGFASLMVLHLSRASAQWWHRAPADFEECAEAADKSATREEKSAALAQCNSKFAGRRKPGGGYAYYDFMQDRSFDIVGPNPTPEEQKYIDEQYTSYLEKQRRNKIAAAFAKQQQLQLEQASLRTETTGKIPVPVERPKVLQQQAGQAQSGDPRSRMRGNANCPRHTFSCEWPRLSDTVNDLKKLFSSSGKAKKS
jgi:hypothetical protein